MLRIRVFPTTRIPLMFAVISCENPDYGLPLRGVNLEVAAAGSVVLAMIEKDGLVAAWCHGL